MASCVNFFSNHPPQETLLNWLCFYQNRDHWLDMMAYNIALNGSFFNTHRMVAQYLLEAYFR